MQETGVGSAGLGRLRDGGDVGHVGRELHDEGALG